MNEFQKHMYHQALTDGDFSDVTVRAFGNAYKLHRIHLSRSPFFKALMLWPNVSDEDLDESENIYKVSVHTIKTDDPLITKTSFELLLRRLYGCEDPILEKKHSLNMFATGIYFGIDEIVTDAINNLKKELTMESAISTLNLLPSKDYGKLGQELLQESEAFLSNFGWNEGYQKWDSVPGSVVNNVVGDSAFFVPTEYERAIFLIKLVERRMRFSKSNKIEKDIEQMSHALNEKIIYSTMNINDLQALSKMNDKNGKPFIKPETLLSATWELTQVQLNVKASTNCSLKTQEVCVPGKDVATRCYYARSNYIAWNRLSNQTVPIGKENDFISTSIPPLRFGFSIGKVLEISTGSRGSTADFSYCGSNWRFIIKKVSSSCINLYLVLNTDNVHMYFRDSYSGGYQYSQYDDNPNVHIEMLTKKSNDPIIGLPYTDEREYVKAYLNIYLRSNWSGAPQMCESFPPFQLKNFRKFPGSPNFSITESQNSKEIPIDLFNYVSQTSLNQDLRLVFELGLC
ncbi:unnamed protein product [Ambrosiozyma monospora]|uniref:Unnamed protein product n=1 Tax=Ambrosiozyma monospora TaxID=43982 RepID=A0A9W6YTC6_AMBMO|nr:unnamed protein product [Ambrosiozyma monospora]